MSRQTFELNGRTYDALTGAMLADGATAAPSLRPRPAAAAAGRLHPQPARRPSIDGMVRLAGVSGIGGGLAASAKPTAHAAAPARPARPIHLPKHAAAHQPQPSQTLMRRAVKTPSAASLDGLVSKPAPSAAKPSIQPARGIAPSVVPKLSSSVVNPRRAAFARGVGRSQAVQRFSASSDAQQAWGGGAATSVAGLQLQPQATVAAAPATPAPIRPRSMPASRAYGNFAAPTRRPSAAAQPARPQPADVDDDQDIFTRALAEASSHQEAAPANLKSRKRAKRAGRLAGFAALAAVFLAAVGFVGYQNRDDIRLQLASAKAGFPASAPLYKPEGFGLAAMKYATGSVASVYSHGGQNFTITQKKSNWDSQTLLENFVATTSGSYQGFQSNGRTVYIYGKGNATWVNGGIWYQIKATGNLTDQQLVRIAASM